MGKNYSLLILLSVIAINATTAQQQKNVLFIGNSYTAVNNMPHLVQQIASSVGDELVYQANTPGGCTFTQHCSNQSMQLICQGGWDAVVLQEQSQYPSFPQWQVESQVFPYAQRLVDSAYAHAPCTEPMFYMTWGRKYGDQGNAEEFPVLGTYEGMDSMLCLRYTYMAQQFDASLCPVGRVWHHIRDNHPEIELYQSDNSHPSLAGSYAAACSFYVLLFHRDPDIINFDAELPETTARTIRSAVREVVFDQLPQWLRPMPVAALQTQVNTDSTVLLTSYCLNADSVLWSFGDGTDTLIGSGQQTVIHHYSDTGHYTITLVASRHCMTDTATSDIHIESPEPVEINTLETPAIQVMPNPATDHIVVQSTSFDGPVSCKLYSLSGALLFKANHPLPVTIPISNLSAGSYLLRIVTPSNAVTQQMVIVR